MTNFLTQQHLTTWISRIGVENQLLLARSLDLGLIEEAKLLQQADRELQKLWYKVTNFDFVETIARGRTLLVGEGNLSFSLSLTRKKRITPNNLTVTTFENTNELNEETINNAKNLRKLGVFVMHGVDATKLFITLGSVRFDNIVFQFPHTGSREPIDGHNPNFILLRDFLKSAKKHLAIGGRILVSTVDNPHYNGAFQFDEAAAQSGFEAPKKYPFDPSAYAGYTHNMTHEDESALDRHDTFATWVFRAT